MYSTQPVFGVCRHMYSTYVFTQPVFDVAVYVHGTPSMYSTQPDFQCL